MKKLILVTSPPACGKTFISKQLARRIKHIVYLDKDTLIPLSKQIFAVANQPYDRSSDFFNRYIRDYEYIAIEELAMEALEYADTVLINAPFTKEIRNPKFMMDLRSKLAQHNAQLIVIWVTADVETVHQRMIDRGSDRDKSKLENWDEYIAGCNFHPPLELLGEQAVDRLLFFNNSTDAEYEESMERIAAILEK